MAEPLKNMYSKPYLEKFAEVFWEEDPNFDRNKFLKLVFNNEWDSKELKQRMSHIARSLHIVLPGDYKRNIGIIKKAIPNFNGFLSMIFPDYVEQYGLDDPETSIKALELFTQYGSSEFAVRPFIIKYPKVMQQQIIK